MLVGPPPPPPPPPRPSPAAPPPDLNCKLSPPDPNSKPMDHGRVFPVGPQLLDRSVPCRTRTPTSGSEGFPARTSTASARSQCSPPDPNTNLWSKAPCWTSTASARSHCSPPHPNSNLWSKVFELLDLNCKR